jgi:DNA repair protein RadC
MEYTRENLTIKAWAEDDRPREKLISKGRQALSDAELIAILIGSGTRKETAVELSKRILGQANNDLNHLGKMSFGELTKFRGIGEAKALSIVAALELGRRRKESDLPKRERIASSSDIFDIMKPIFMDMQHEEFWVLMLNRSNSLIKKEFVSRGGVAGTVVDPKIVFKTALDTLASSIVLCHNHPSGNLKPSEADIKLTKKLKDAGTLLEIPVLDHIIITDTGYYSFADEGAL